MLLASAIKVMAEYQRIVIFRLGRLLGIKGPGLVFVVPIIDRLVSSTFKFHIFLVKSPTFMLKYHKIYLHIRNEYLAI